MMEALKKIIFFLNKGTHNQCFYKSMNEVELTIIKLHALNAVKKCNETE